MAHFSIISSVNGEVLYSGTPRYYGTFLKPGYLEFAEIAASEPINWHIGDYVEYSRTGMRYRLYSIPAVSKRADILSTGESFVYENVQFFDNSKMLELAAFIDLVPADNLIHYSTQNAVFFTGTPQQLAARVQTCLEYWFPSERWSVSIIANPTGDLAELLATELDFGISGESCQQALERMYEQWPGLGWSFSIRNGVNTIVIGAPNQRTNANTTEEYSVHSGLVSLKRSVSNADEIGTRLYVYGSLTNMLGDYYRNQNIKDAESVDIQHLMLPISAVASLNYSGWGTTGGLPDARKAYLESEAGVSALGLIPKYAYFDGSDSNRPEIYPSLEGVTIGDVIDAKTILGDTDYVPSLAIYSREDRVDEVIYADNPEDDGVVAEDGKSYNEKVHAEFLEQFASCNWQTGEPANVVLGTLTTTHDGEVNVHFEEAEAYILTKGATPVLDVMLRLTFSNGAKYDTPLKYTGPTTVTEEGKVWNKFLLIMPEDISAAGLWSSGQIQVSLVVSVVMKEKKLVEEQIDIDPEENPYEYDVVICAHESKVDVTTKYSLGNSFVVELRQIGFDIDEMAALGEGKVLSMKTGMCAGRDFVIDHCTYVEATDSWLLTCLRQKDDDTGMLYPNAQFPIKFYGTNDKCVILQIAMPELYVVTASRRLLKVGQELLSEIDHEIFLYEPDIDAKFVIKNSRILRAGMWMHLVSDEIVSGGEDFSVIDSITIDEGAESIPTYDVKLREKKGLGWTESVSVKPESKSTALWSSISTALQGIQDLRLQVHNSYNDSLEFSRRRYSDVNDTASMLAEALLHGFTDSISPITVRTMQQIVGDESLQFRFVTSKIQPYEVVHTFSFDPDTKVFSTDDGIIQHMTLGITEISSSHDVADYHFWDIDEFEQDLTATPEKRYYLYAKCSTTTADAEFVLSETAIEMNSVPGYFHLLVGLLNSEFDGDRSFATMYGFTEILPGQITVNRIGSPDGTTYWDLVSNIVHLGNHLSFSPAGGLVLNNTLVQTGEGTERLSVWCGAYVSSRRYAYPDEVVWTNTLTGETATYRYINPTPSSGHLPTDTNYWQVVAKGLKGDDGVGTAGQGTVTSIVFKRSATTPDRPGNGTTPDTPTYGGTYFDPVPYGWSDGIPAITPGGPVELWMSTRIFTSDGLTPQEAQWSLPTPATDTADLDFEYCEYDATDPDEVLDPTQAEEAKEEDPEHYDGPEWHNDPAEGDNWMAMRKKINGTYGEWKLTMFKGEDGAQGRGILRYDVQYQVGADGRTIPSGIWVDDITQAVPQPGQYLWTRRRPVYTDNTAGAWEYANSRQSLDGTNGDAGPATIYMGSWQDTMMYYASPSRCDIIYYPPHSKYYIAKTTVKDGKIPPNNPPLLENDPYWIPFGASFDTIATAWIFAEKATFENAIVRRLHTVNVDTGATLLIENSTISMLSGNDLRLKISGEDLSSVSGQTETHSVPSSLYSATTSADDIRDGSTENLFADVTVGTFTAASAANTLRLPAMTLAVNLSTYTAIVVNGFSASVRVVWLIDNVEYGEAAFACSPGAGESGDSGTATMAAQSLSLSAGQHTVKLRTYVNFEGPEYGLNGEGQAYSNPVTVLVSHNSSYEAELQYVNQVTEFGPNGMRVRFGSDYQFYVIKAGADPSSMDFHVQVGSYGLKVTNSAVQYRDTDGWHNVGSGGSTPASLSLQLNGAGIQPGTTAAWYAPITAGTDGYILKSNGSGAPVWSNQLSVASLTTTGQITSGGDILPDITATRSLGAMMNRWDEAWARAFYVDYDTVDGQPWPLGFRWDSTTRHFELIGPTYFYGGEFLPMASYQGSAVTKTLGNMYFWWDYAFVKNLILERDSNNVNRGFSWDSTNRQIMANARLKANALETTNLTIGAGSIYYDDEDGKFHFSSEIVIDEQ